MFETLIQLNESHSDKSIWLEELCCCTAGKKCRNRIAWLLSWGAIEYWQLPVMSCNYLCHLTLKTSTEENLRKQSIKLFHLTTDWSSSFR